MEEGTGLDVSIIDLLYICDRIREGSHIVHITPSASKKGGVLGTKHGLEFTVGKIKSVKWVPFGELESHGVTKTFYALVESDFSDKGAYRRDISNIGL
jgi:hypothetical protein